MYAVDYCPSPVLNKSAEHGWIKKGTAMATKYRCYLVRDEHIAANEIIECDGDGAAVLAADQILSASEVYTQAEVWDCARMVSIISRRAKRP
jgi:hypothetical protein